MYRVEYVFDEAADARGFTDGFYHERVALRCYLEHWSLVSLNDFTPSTALGTLDPRNPAFLAWWDAEVRFLIDLIEQRVKSLRERGIGIKMGYHGACTLREYS